MNDLYQLAFEQIGDPVLVHLLDGQIIAVNDAASRLTGYSKEELLKRRLSDIEVPGIDSNQLERPKGQINGSSIFNRLLRTRDGLAVLIEVSAAPLMINGEEAMVEVGRDISDHERLGMYTVDPSNRLSSIFNSVQAGVLLIDRETHQIVDVNLIGERMFGAQRDKLIGSVCHNFICPADKGRCPVTDLGQKVESSERLLVRNDGELLPITKTVVELSIGDKKFLLESFIDISNVKAAEKALKLSNERYQDLSPLG